MGKNTTDDYVKDGLEALGRIRDAETRTIIIEALSYFRQLTLENISTLAEIVRDVTYLATKSYEGNRITTGVLIGESEKIEEAFSDEWILKLTNPIGYPSEKDQLESIALLANGIDSLIALDYSGIIYGVINTARITYGPEIGFGGFKVRTNRHGETLLSNAEEVVCFHDGYEWKAGQYTGEGHLGKLEFVNEWRFHGRELHKVDYYNDWYWFTEILASLSERRISSIFALCDEQFISLLRRKGVLSSLRPELNSVFWGYIGENTRAYTNIFRLDGVHFLSKDLRTLSVCQKISIPSGGKAIDPGAGRSAARYLSSTLGEAGMVIKVSSDGPISVFSKGESI